MSSNLFFSVEIRNINFNYDRYYLSLDENNDKKILNDFKSLIAKNNNDLLNDSISDITDYTVVPKFFISKMASPILYKIFNIDYSILHKNKIENNNGEVPKNKNSENEINEEENEDNEEDKEENDINADEKKKEEEKNIMLMKKRKKKKKIKMKKWI